ncbi:uncharacterized protein LOC123668162 [Melitaea cinxia]|uniref:uncharacterized protein LOC123664927 n=1 Tax=Melitaea cinxia TaxID=113334 RepID=UPI001E2723AE|nr:uncharacterized protein LOC123664927 [Melitaea cinxia]XP_045456910.1 uncharacterized protein LOC123666938 [Melitaea cinxia]XP_045457910.1 uncharacterized protein LOC123668162 [Melitaea cinxia]
MANKCHQCGKFIATADGAKCTKCACLFHRLCVNLSPDHRIPLKWQCQGCKSGPMEGVSHNKINSLTSSPDTDIFLEAADNTVSSLAQEMRLLRAELGSVAKTMSSFKEELARLNTVVGSLTKKFEDIEVRLNVLEASNGDRSSVTNDQQLSDLVAQLRAELNDREQEGLQNDIEIAGLEEKNGENPTHLVLSLATKLGYELEERDVVSAERVGSRRVYAVSSEHPRSRPIVVRLARRAVRDAMIRAARVRRGTDSAGVTEGEPRSVYVNERLTPTNRNLFFKTREECRRAGWKHVWTRNGRIFTRKSDVTEIRRVRAISDLNKIFGACNI